MVNLSAVVQEAILLHLSIHGTRPTSKRVVEILAYCRPDFSYATLADIEEIAKEQLGEPRAFCPSCGQGMYSGTTLSIACNDDWHNRTGP